MPAAACVMVISRCLKCCLLMLLSLFSLLETRQLAGKKHMISCSLNINIHVAIRHHAVKPRAGEVFLFSATEASKRSKLVILEVLPV